MNTRVLLFLFAAVGLSSAAARANGPIEIILPVDKVYVPSGFDDNDNIEVGLKGLFKSSCYKVSSSAAVVDHVARTITVTATALEYSGACADVVVPFLEVVKVGTLLQGDYTVVVAGRTATGTVSVARRTTEAPDDYLYAPVQQAGIDQDSVTRRQTLHLTGRYPYCFIGCMKIREVKTYRSPADVLVVLPIADLIDGPECEERQGNQDFDVKVPMQEPFNGEGMMHVRVLNGASLNRFLEIY